MSVCLNYETCICVPFLSKQTVQTWMKCHLLWHFIWVFTVCQIINMVIPVCQAVSSMKRVLHAFLVDCGGCGTNNLKPSKTPHFQTRAFAAILGKGPWPKLGKNDRLNIKIGRNKRHRT